MLLQFKPEKGQFSGLLQKVQCLYFQIALFAQMFLNLQFETNLRLKGLPSKSNVGSLVCREVAFCTKVTQVYGKTGCLIFKLGVQN